MKEITASDIVHHLSVSDCVGVMEKMYLEDREALSSHPQRSVSRIDEDSIILNMAGYSPRLERFAVKIVSEFKKNPERHSKPVQGGLIILMDAKTSEVLAALDAPMITEIRTAAISALATKILARKDSDVVGIIGSGAEARRLLEAVVAVSSRVKRAHVYSLHHANALKFSEEMSKKLNLDIEAKSERADALAHADIIIVATNSKTPVTRWSEIGSGCHVNSIGTLHRELDRQTVVNSKVFADSREGVMTDAPDVIEAFEDKKASSDHIQADLSELLSGEKPGRQSENEVTLFKSVGFALQDVHAASFVYDKMFGEGKF